MFQTQATAWSCVCFCTVNMGLTTPIVYLAGRNLTLTGLTWHATLVAANRSSSQRVRMYSQNTVSFPNLLLITEQQYILPSNIVCGTLQESVATRRT